eukprot:1578295-Prymnesium_polylepis.1
MGVPGHSRRSGQLSRAPACPISDHQTHSHTVGFGAGISSKFLCEQVIAINYAWNMSPGAQICA